MARNETKNTFVCYLRVSTSQQGKSGLGIEAQRETVTRFVSERGGKIVAPEFVEVESGKNNKRPELAKALKRCRLTGATLVVAKLDRLSRNAAFLLMLRDSGVNFVAADLPDANTMTVGVMATVAQYEAEAISARTVAALKAARARGKVLGGVRVGSLSIAQFTAKANQAVTEKAQRDAEECRDVIEALVAEGLSMNAIASRLNETGIRTPRKCTWEATTVKRTLARLGIERAA